jgi:hypothetical protein
MQNIGIRTICDRSVAHIRQARLGQSCVTSIISITQLPLIFALVLVFVLGDEIIMFQASSIRVTDELNNSFLCPFRTVTIEWEPSAVQNDS